MADHPGFAKNPRFRSRRQTDDGVLTPVGAEALAATTPGAALPQSETDARNTANVCAECARAAALDGSPRRAQRERDNIITELEAKIAELQEQIQASKEQMVTDQAEIARLLSMGTMSWEIMTTRPGFPVKSATGFDSPEVLLAFYDLLNFDGAAEHLRIYKGPKDLEPGSHVLSDRRGQKRAMSPQN